jgi:pyoverdine/dityrosine biosynthesis protein Dit1
MAKRAYSREEPYLETEIKERIHHFVSLNEPIKFIGFWGIGNKIKPNWADRTTCEYLTKMNTEVKNIYSPGIEFTFIFATFH